MTITQLLDTDEQLAPLPMMLRALLVFFAALLLLRVGGIRIFGQKSALDNVIVIMLGAVLARGVVGASPLFSAIAASGVMVVVNRLLAWASERNNELNRLLKGNAVVLFENGKLLDEAMKQVNLSKSDLLESLHLEMKQESFEGIDKVILETNGRISFIAKKQ
ncbi:DUF421 domain-containing protein [Taibaiella chishuiensis]|uniref:Uncharacterized protein DUF421 n=1 Tax=Taibaiella chishuiensis TaxID=1434707 RepID=A0A2P8D379_9BACT|nr:YetF domain-containing protein [Taibaiella chishuiensis]PSK91665.1 uncharacterized protein DUF421 [Taibaiella chishuiensis]